MIVKWDGWVCKLALKDFHSKQVVFQNHWLIAASLLQEHCRFAMTSYNPSKQLPPMEYCWLPNASHVPKKRDFRPLMTWHFDRVKEKSPIYLSEHAPHGGALKYTYERTALLCSKLPVSSKPKCVYIFKSFFSLVKIRNER